MTVQIPLDSLEPWEEFILGSIKYRVILKPLTITGQTILCLNSVTQLMESLKRKVKVRRA